MLVIANTYKCNFECQHCCMESSPRFKEMITDWDYMDAIKLFAPERIHIVGGEPFLHPRINWQLEYATWAAEHVSLVTNGSWILTRQGNPTKKFKEFEEAMMNVDTSKITMSISRDYWHDEFHRYMDFDKAERWLESVDVNVSQAFQDINNMRGVLPIGRAVKTEVYQKNSFNKEWDAADCSDSFSPTVTPSGGIAICCNGRQVIGSVRNTIEELEERYEQVKKPVGTDVMRGCANCKVNSVFSPAYGEAHIKELV